MTRKSDLKQRQKLPEGLLTQAAPITSVDEDKRTVEVVFSTGDLIPHWVRHNGSIQRMPTRVVVDKKAANLDFLKRAGPVLDNHSSWGSSRAVIGAVEDAWIDGGVAKARLRFSSAEDVEPIWQRVREGVLRNVSMGFTVKKQEISLEDGEDGSKIEVIRFTSWEPLEISMVAVPADKAAHVQADGEDEDRSESEEDDALGQGATEAPEADAAEGADEEGAAAAAETTQGDDDMSDQTTGAATQAPDADEIRQQERARIADIRQTASTLNVDDTIVQAAIDDGVTVDDFRKQAIEAFAQKGQRETKGVAGPRAEITQDGHERFRQGALEGIMARAGMEGGQRNEFSGLTLAELARQSLTVANARIPSDRREMVGLAFVQAGSHTTSDFANVLANLMGKAALRGWEEAEETYQLWTRTGTLTDFKKTKRVGLGLFNDLPEVGEDAEYTYGTVGDRGEEIVLATYGKMLRITRQAIINDDLALFSSIPMKMGRAARRTIGNLVYGVLTGNPTMADGTALFHADHNNLASSGGAPSVTTLGAAKAAMRKQKEKAGGPSLNIPPRYMITPAALETSTAQLLNSAVDPTANKGHAANPVAGMAELITDARLDDASATAWYLAADPNAFDTIEVAFLDGVMEPYLEEKTAWSSDGVELKVRIDAGVAPLDHRGLYKNAGA